MTIEIEQSPNNSNKSLDTNRQLLDLYLSFPKEGQINLITSLMVASTYVPTAADKARLSQSETGQKLLEREYARLANGYAESVDENYKPGEFNNPTTEKARGIFYRMIRPFTAEQIDEAVKAIIRHEKKNAPPKK